MNDDNLIDELRDGMRARTDRTEVPDGFADHARRTARRRSARRAAAAGPPLLVAAGVATVLATGAGSGSSSPRGAQGPTVTVGGGQAYDTAYIVKRVRAKVAADGQHGMVVHSYGTGGGSYSYTAPDGTSYSQKYSTDPGPTGVSGFFVLGPVVNGKYFESETIINNANHTYSQTQGENPDPSSGSGNTGNPSTLNLESSPSEVQQGLQSGQVTQKGTTTVNGRQAIALFITLPNAPSGGFTLYVDAQTYQPLRTTVMAVINGKPVSVGVADWMPATPDTIAKAKNDPIPAGYTKVDPGVAAAGNTGVG